MIEKYIYTDCCAEKLNEIIEALNKQEKELYNLQLYIFKLTNKDNNYTIDKEKIY